MPITLYHSPHSRSVRCIWALGEMGLDYELVTLKFPPRVHHKEFKAINPLGTVPCMVDGDLVLTESSAIVQYLVERYGPTPLAVAATEPDYGAYLNWLHRADATLTFPLALVFRYRDLEAPERAQSPGGGGLPPLVPGAPCAAWRRLPRGASTSARTASPPPIFASPMRCTSRIVSVSRKPSPRMCVTGGIA